MDNKLNSVPSVGAEVENSTNVEVSSVSPNDVKPIVGCSASLSTEKYADFYNPNRGIAKPVNGGSLIGLKRLAGCPPNLYY